MGFIENNQHFINIELISNMRGLDVEQRKERYAVVRPEVHKRIEKTYSQSLDKSKFYLELFQTLHEFDIEYLLFNLFLDRQSNSITNFLCSKKVFLHLSVDSSSELIYSYFNFIREKSVNNEVLSARQQDLFVKQKFLDIVQTATDNIWIQENERVNRLVHAYVDWLTENLEKNLYVIQIDSLVLLCKIWNSYESFYQPFNNSKAIVLYHQMNVFLEQVILKEEGQSFLQFIQKAKKIFENFFVPLYYVPLIDEDIDDSYGKGYLRKREEFFSILDSINQIGNINKYTSYTDIINQAKSASNELLDYLKEVCKTKIMDRNLPTDNEVFELKQPSFDQQEENLKKLLREKFYLF